MNKEELEQEAEEKAKKRTKGFACQENCEKSYVMGALDFAEPREKQIAELEKENAELKEKLGDVQMQKAGEKSDLVWKLKTANEQKKEQLTKAKELIKGLLIICSAYGAIDKTIIYAEQFLKEADK